MKKTKVDEDHRKEEEQAKVEAMEKEPIGWRDICFRHLQNTFNAQHIQKKIF